MLIWICIGINLINAVYFTVKKQKAVSLVYYFSLILMGFLSLFYIDDEIAVELLKDGLGESIYSDIFYSLHSPYYLITPHLGFITLSIIAAVAILLKATENVFRFRKNKCETIRLKRELINECVIENTSTHTTKIYLFNCTLLC